MIIAVLLIFALIGGAIAFVENTKSGNKFAEWVLKKFL